MLTNLWYEGAGGRGLLVQVQRPPADAGPHPRHRRAEVAPDGHALHPPRQRRLRAHAHRRHRHLRPRPAAGDVRARTARARARPATSRGNVPATLALTLGTPATLGAFVPGVAADYTASMTADGHLDRRRRRAERDRPELDRHRPAGQRHASPSPSRCRSTPTTARSRRCGPTTARSTLLSLEHAGQRRERRARLQADDRRHRGPAHRHATPRR